MTGDEPQGTMGRVQTPVVSFPPSFARTISSKERRLGTWQTQASIPFHRARSDRSVMWKKSNTIGKSQFSFYLFMALFNMPFPVRLDRKKMLDCNFNIYFQYFIKTSRQRPQFRERFALDLPNYRLLLITGN